MKRKIVGYTINYCDQQGLDVTYTFDPDIPGGVCCRSEDEPIAMFAERSAAKRAVQISELAAKLAKARGEIANEDFLDKSRKNIRIVRVESPD